MLRRNITIVNIKRKRKKIIFNNKSFFENLLRYKGQTVTIITVSDVETGVGFTGVLLDISRDYIKLLTEAGSAPDCIQTEDVSLGSITDIPINKIVAFVHNAT